MHNILITVPKLSGQGGVSNFWNSLFTVLNRYKSANFTPFEIGGHGKNILGPIQDQLSFHKRLKKEYDLYLLNPSLLVKSFFRDGFFAKQLVKKKLPFVVFFHGWDSDFQKKIDTKHKKFFQNSFAHAKKIFVLSPEFKEKLHEWGYKGEVIVQTTTVDASLVNNFSLMEKREKKKITNEPIKLLFLSRLVKEKGIFELIDAFKNLSKKREDIELIIAGDGEAFSAVQERLKNQKNIKLTGFVEGEEKIELFKTSDLYLLPSYTEGLPVSVLEAMLFGLPILTTNVGGLKTFFKNEEMGYFINTKETKDIEEKIELLLSNKKKMEEISTFNYNYAQKYLTNEIVAKELYQHLKELL